MARFFVHARVCVFIFGVQCEATARPHLGAKHVLPSVRHVTEPSKTWLREVWQVFGRACVCFRESEARREHQRLNLCCGMRCKI